MPRQRVRRRFLPVSIGFVVALATLVFLSGRSGFWSLGGIAVQVFDPNATLFGSQGVLVCAPPGSWGIPQAGNADLSYLHIAPDTPILDQRTSFSPIPARITDLRRGQRLRVWTNGGAVFSYPLQVNAQRVVIENDGQPTALDCQWRGLAP